MAFYRASIGGGGPTPTNITPSNSSPAAMAQDGVYKASRGGYAIQSYSSKTPNDSSPPQVSAGDIVKVTTNGGYLYKTQQGGSGYSSYSDAFNYISSTSSTFTLSNMKGKKLLVYLFYQAGSAQAYNRLDGATASGGTISKLCNLRNTNGNAYGTFYNLNVTSNSCVITAPYNCFCRAFEAA